jgi:hypothetical protein
MSALWPVAIVSTERKGKTDRNDWNTACGNFKTSISSGNHYKNGAYSFLLPKNNYCFFAILLFSSDIYWQQFTTFSTMA